MEFKENSKPIYQQIADRLCDETMNGRYPPDTRIPSVREYAAVMQVNVNTMMRAYEYLQQRGIIYNKRGIGYFISSDAPQKIAEMRQATFFDEEVSYFFARLKSIGVSPEELVRLYENFNSEQSL